MDQAVDLAAAYCIRQGIMSDILLPFRAEVKKMLLTEYDEKKTMRLFRKEFKEEGRREGLKEGLKEGRKEGLEEGIKKERNNLITAMLRNGASVEEISEMTDLPRQEIEDVKAVYDANKK